MAALCLPRASFSYNYFKLDQSINQIDQINSINSINPINPINSIHPIEYINQSNQSINHCWDDGLRVWTHAPSFGTQQ